MILLSRSVFCVAFFGALGLFYVWQNVQVIRQGFQIMEKEESLSKHQRTSQLLETELATLMMPKRIQKQIMNKDIPLELARGWHVIYLNETPFFYLDEMPINPKLDGNGVIGHTIINIAKLNLNTKDRNAS